MREKVLVTGGTGYIGSHTVVELLNAGHEVVVIDNLENSTEKVLNGIEKICGKRPEFYKVELRNADEVKRFFRSNSGFDAVIHFAAYKAVGESFSKPWEYYHNNINSLLYLLKEMKERGINKLVFSSSCTVYGQPDELPVSETSPRVRPTSPYGNTKKVSEEIIEDIAAISDLQCINLRYFNPIGAHPSAHIGELPVGVPNNLLPYITQTAAGEREYVTVFGGDYSTKDGTCVRDYIHVTDVAKAHVAACRRLWGGQNKSNIEYFNLGTGEGYSVLDIINTFERVSGQKLPYKIGERRQGDVSAVYGDPSLANKELNWKAGESLETMIRSAWTWQKSLVNEKTEWQK